MLFDLDGTLLETAAELADAINDTLADVGLPALEPQRVRDWIGRGTRELLARSLMWACERSDPGLSAHGLLDDALLRFDRHYLQRCGTCSHLYPQVREVLQALRLGGIKLAVVTNKDSRYTLALLHAHQLVFDHVVSGDSFPQKKPDPSGVLSCLERFGVSAARTLFVGDSAIDVATARAAGVTVWALPYGYNMGRPIQECAPDRVIADFSALTALL